MINFIPIFPLEIVVYPGEHLNLHIFEPRYKQLIKECYQNNKPFGIPLENEEKIREFGCLISIREIVKTYPDGEMDIQTTGESVFRILEIIDTVPDKLYSGAIVDYPDNHLQGKADLMNALIVKMRDFHQKMDLRKDFSVKDEELTAYDIAHDSGLSIEQEYQLLQLFNEKQRQEYLRRHFENLSASLPDLKTIREKIQMNGHFRSIKSF
ncbi:MAG: LON peptidase substrate-binding domain-containing protein [Sphingobacteriales bacterium]|nr:LON peptidase substrate-binding domain-containing protein [Sphingobacteriales bacterium]